MKRIINYIFHRDHFIVTVSAFAQLGLLAVIVFNLDFLNPVANALENFSVTDMFFEIQHSGAKQETSDLITLVDMTELHSRRDLANLLEEINQNDPLMVGVDLIFEGEKDDSLGNEMLKGAVAGLADKSVFATKLIDYDSSSDSFDASVSSFFIGQVEYTEAYTNLNDNMERSRIRDFSIKQKKGNEEMLSFPAKIASAFDPSVAELHNNDLLINFRNVSFPVVPFNEIQEHSESIEGHIVLVGTMTEEQDMHNSPLGKMSGLELQAYSLLTLMEHKAIREVPAWLMWLIAFILCYLLELSADAVFQLAKKNNHSAIMVFIRESNLADIIVLFIWMALLCWILFILFVKYSISLQGGILLGLMALVCEGRDLYKAVIKTMGVQFPDSKFISSSLLKDND